MSAPHSFGAQQVSPQHKYVQRKTAPEPVQHPWPRTQAVHKQRTQPTGRAGRPGGHGGERTPDPIPNSAVKTPSAYDTASQDAGKSVAARSSNPASTHTITTNAGWSSPVARQAHNLKVTGSNPVPATTDSLLPIAPASARAMGVFCCPACHQRSAGLPAQRYRPSRGSMQAFGEHRGGDRSTCGLLSACVTIFVLGHRPPLHVRRC